MSNVHKVDPGQVPTTAVKSSDVSRIVDQKLKDVESKLDKRYAKVNHTHDSADMSGYASKKHGHSMDDISGLNNAIKKASKVPDTFADKKHRHSVADIDGQIPVEKVKGVDSVVQKGVAGLAKENHRHVNLEKQLSNVEQGIKGLEKVVERKLGSDDKRDLEKMFKEAISELKNELVRIEKEIPTIEDDPVEMVSSRYFLVPEKSNGS
jgi:hypothetical protein